MRTVRWLAGLLRRRPWEMSVPGLSIALMVAFVASLGAFVTQSHSALTLRAASSVAVDWQVEVTSRGNLAKITQDVDALPAVRAVERVDFAHVRALESRGAEGARTTGE